MSAGIQAFREAYLTHGVQPGQDAAWADPDARALRYDLLWSYFESTVYRDAHNWSQSFRSRYGLYAHIRSIYNPAYRLVEFWVAHLLGGQLDPAAGDGKSAPSALPIILGEGARVRQGAALRRAIAQLWLDSNWAIKKDVLSRYGAALGDVGIRVVDDLDRGKVYLQVVHPATIREMTVDPFGHVKAYALEEQRASPNNATQTVTYRETAERDGENVIYRTYLNNQPYPWNGQTAEWSEPYGFAPLVLIKHIDVGRDWGWSELYPCLPKFREVDDIASKLHDQLRKCVDSPWLFAGVQKPTSNPALSRTGSTGEVLPATTNRETGRQEMPILYASDPQARAQPLVAPLDIAGALETINAELREIERDYPELALDVIQTTSGDASGRALRVAREPVEQRVLMRRAAYDSALVRAQQMAIAIGGYRGYSGYEGFGLESYAAGALDHTIGARPVFAPDPREDLDRQLLFWQVAEAAKKSGLPIDLYLEQAGWDAATIDRIRESAAERLTAMQQAMQSPSNGGNADVSAMEATDADTNEYSDRG